MYRPQFPYATPDKCVDQRCVYSFDQTNTPYLTMTLDPGQNFSRIPLQLDKDADFYLRGIAIPQIGAGTLELRLEDPKGHPLSDIENLITEIDYQYAGLYSDPAGAGIVALDSDDFGVFCQAGSRLYLYCYNNGASGVSLTTLVINLHGVKRYSGERCAA
jgi:hypothetical protein